MSPMPASRFLRAVSALLLGPAVLVTVSPVTASPVTASPARAALPAGDPAANAVRVLRYDASRAAEFRTVMDQAARVWNASVANVRLVAGTPADFVVRADDGWPRTSATGLGRGTIWLGREATAGGYSPLRIATHEIGHILGLPDRRTGLCADLMSGHSAPVSCANAAPSAAERHTADANFAYSAQRATPRSASATSRTSAGDEASSPSCAAQASITASAPGASRSSARRSRTAASTGPPSGPAGRATAARHRASLSSAAVSWSGVHSQSER